MKLFLDTAYIKHVEQWAFFIDGVTTNPTNLSEQEGNPSTLIKNICNLLPDKDINVEVTETDPSAIFVQAQQIAALAPNITVKIPCHASYYPLIDHLVKKGIAVNVTLVFSLVQALYMCKLGVKYISPFVGRWDQVDVDGTQVLYEIRQAVDYYNYNTQILAASLHTVTHIHQALLAGADVVTLAPTLLEQSMVHLLTEQGIARFSADWSTLRANKFPE